MYKNFKKSHSKKIVSLGLTVLIAFSTIGTLSISNAFAESTEESSITDTYLPGDINNDNKLTVVDMIMLQKHISKIAILSDAQLSSADINGDGKINISDTVRINKCISKIVPIPDRIPIGTKPELVTEPPTIAPTEPVTAAPTEAPTKAPSPIGIKLNKETLTVGNNETYIFSVTANSKIDIPYTFSSSNEKVATVNSSGKVTAISTGNTYISVKTIYGETASCLLTVKKEPSKVWLNAATLTLAIGSQYDLNSYVPAGEAAFHISYSSNNSSVASVVSAGGLVTAKKVGTATITAKTYNGKTTTCVVTVKDTVENTYKAEVLSVINKYRVANRKPKLVIDTQTQKAADKRAKELGQRYSHTRPDGQQWYTVFSEYNIANHRTAENIGYGYDTGTDIANAWIASYAHRQNLLDEQYEYTGIGVYVDSDGTIYGSQLFVMR